jgi:hypothetical protein
MGRLYELLFEPRDSGSLEAAVLGKLSDISRCRCTWPLSHYPELSQTNPTPLFPWLYQGYTMILSKMYQGYTTIAIVISNKCIDYYITV